MDRADSHIVNVRVASRWIRPASSFIIAFIAAPFLYAGIARVIPSYTSFWDVAIGLVAAASVAIFAPKLRGAALGFGIGSAAYAIFFLWLFTTMGSID